MNIVIAIAILFIYTFAIIIGGGGVPSSLSASVFHFQQKDRWIWTVVIYSVCFFCLMPFDFFPYSVSYLDKVSENTQFLAFIAIAALAFVGAAPLVKDKTDLAYKVHCGAAVVWAVCSQLVLVFNQPLLLFCWFPFAVAFVYMWAAHFAWRTKTFWAEMVCFCSTFAFCLI